MYGLVVGGHWANTAWQFPAVAGPGVIRKNVSILYNPAMMLGNQPETFWTRLKRGALFIWNLIETNLPLVVSAVILLVLVRRWFTIETLMAQTLTAGEIELYERGTVAHPFALTLLAPIISMLSVLFLIRVKEELHHKDEDWVYKQVKHAVEKGWHTLSRQEQHDKISVEKEAALKPVQEAAHAAELRWGYLMLAVGFGTEAASLLVSRYISVFSAITIMSIITVVLALRIFLPYMPQQVNIVRARALRKYARNNKWPDQAKKAIGNAP